jgi:hypothetical protein
MNISFSLTTQQVRDRTKVVTRRNGWKNAKVGQVLTACVKCMGLKKGEKIEKICQIRIVSVRSEPLNRLLDSREYGIVEMRNEGFPDWSPQQFIDMYCKHNKCDPFDCVTRIEFEYL